MPVSKTTGPERNILDLRKIVADQRAVSAQKKSRFPAFNAERTKTKRPEMLHRPPQLPRDWLTFRRELLKFGLVLGLAALVTAGVIMTTRLVSAKTSVEQQAHSGLTAMQAGMSALGQSQPVEAERQFQQAIEQFREAATKLNNVAPTAFEHLPFWGQDLAASRRLLKNAQQLASIGQRLSALIPADALQQPAVTIQQDGVISGSIGVLTSLLQHRPEFVSIIDDTVKVVGDMETLSPNDVPASMRERFISWQRILTSLSGSHDSLEHLTSFLVAFLAPAQPREYLVVFQNNDELRATGGFLGTYLLVKFEQGSFKILDAPGNGPYALSDLNAKKNLPPQPILAVAPYWTFHDANWYLDAPTSAEAMLKFYAQDRGFTPDGVVFLTPGIMEDLLRITGPVRPEHYQVDITADNFVKATEQQVEFGYDKALNNPKQFLIDLVPLMLTKLSKSNGPDALRAIAQVLQRANQNDLMFVSSVDDVKKESAALGWDGSLLPVNGDYLSVVDTNLGGGKTDRSVTETVNVKVTLDGSILRHDVAVTRKNTTVATNEYNSFANRTFIRVYAPADAQFIGITGATIPDENFFQPPVVTAKLSPDLLKHEGQVLFDEANGYRITHESGRMVFGAWSRINSGESQTVTFTYTTPAPKNSSTWQLDWQHQPGAPVRTWNVSFKLPDGKKATAVSTGGKLSTGDRTVAFISNSTLSRTFSVTYK